MPQVNLPFDALLNILSIIYSDNIQWRYNDPSLLSRKNILQPALVPVCLVSRQWNAAGTRFLYRDVVLAGERALSVFLETLQNNEDLRPHVRSVFFTLAFSVEEVEDWPNFERCEKLDIVYSMCPKIHFQRVNVAGPAINTSAHGECSGWESLNFQTLTRLELQTSGSVPDTFSPELFLPALKDLIIRGWKVASGENIKPRWPVMPRLWRLCLIDCEFRTATGCLPDFPPGHRGLRVLEVVGGSYGVGLMSSIQRIGHSLELVKFLPFRNSGICKIRSAQTLCISINSMLSYIPRDVVHLTCIRTESIRQSNRDIIDRFLDVHGYANSLQSVQFGDSIGWRLGDDVYIRKKFGHDGIRYRSMNKNFGSPW